MFRRFKGLNPEMGFAENLGVLINMKDMQSPVDADYERWLNDNPDNRCFRQAIPRAGALQYAAQLSPVERSYVAKYPGDTGNAVKAVCAELLSRLAAANAANPQPLAAPLQATPTAIG